MDQSSRASLIPTPEQPKPRPDLGVWAKRVFLALVGTFFLLVIAAVLAVMLIDWNRAKPWVNERVSQATGRHFEVRGDLEAQWVWPQPLDSGWRHWVPSVMVQADEIELGNRPAFGAFGALSSVDSRDKPPSLQPGKQQRDATATPEQTPASPDESTATAEQVTAPLVMARIGTARATLQLLPLLGRFVLIDSLELARPDVALARKADGENNWTFPITTKDDASKPNPWRVDVRQLALSSGQVAYADAAQKLALRAVVDTDVASTEESNAESKSQNEEADNAPKAQRYGLSIKLSGKYRDAVVTGSGRAGKLLTLRETELQYPVEFELSAGSMLATATGTLSNPRKLNGVDMMVTLAGDSMSDLYDLTGLVLPSTPPFKTSGHLVGSLEPNRGTWDYEDFSGVLGKSDLQGHLTYSSGQDRPKLKGQIKSRKLQLADLGPLVGTPDGADANKRKTTRPGKVFPDTEFATERWDAMDMDIAFLGQELIGPSALPLEDMSVRAILKDGVLKLDPLRFGIAKGRIDAQVELNGRRDPLAGEVRATVDDLRLSALFPKVALLDKSFGRMDGAFALRGKGNSIATLLAKSNGESRVYIRDGTFSKELLDLAALNLGSVIVSKLFGPDEEVKLRCAVADLAIKDGMAQTRSVKLSTNEAVVEAVGTLDLGREYMDLRIKPESLEWKFFSLRTPLHVRGPFIKPQVSIEAAPLLLRAGAAVVAAVAAPAALALIPITVPAAEDDAECAKLLARADEAVKAGPSGAKPKPEATAPAKRR